MLEIQVHRQLGREEWMIEKAGSNKNGLKLVMSFCFWPWWHGCPAEARTLESGAKHTINQHSKAEVLSWGWWKKCRLKLLPHPTMCELQNS
jgi:hypothetical protein